MESESTSIDIASIKARALAPVEEQGSGFDSHRIDFAHQALRDVLSQPVAEHVAAHRNLGNDTNSTGLPSTVPETFPNGTTLESLRPEAPTTIPARKMSSQGEGEATQELSPNYWALHISRSRSAAHGRDLESQHTLREGETGHVDLLSSYPDREEEVGNDEEPVPGYFSPTQSPRRSSQFPESQRFKTPATAGRKRDYNGNTRESPELPRAPVLRSGAPTPAHLMGMSQLFEATQAQTSPFVNGGINPLSDRPSPNLDVENRPATATLSSPLMRPMSSGFRRATTEPASRYISVAQSQAERELRVQNGEESDVSDNDDFDADNSLLRRQWRQKQRNDKIKQHFQQLASPTKARPRGNSAVQSSPVLPAQRSSMSPAPGPRLSGSQHAFSPDYERKRGEDVEPSEAETEQEDEVDVRRSSQTSPMDDEDKENQVRIPETTAALPRTLNRLPSELEASPSLRHGSRLTTADGRPVASSGPVAIANSQPSQPLQRSQLTRQQPKSSSTSGPDFVPQSQAIIAQQLPAADGTQDPPPSPKLADVRAEDAVYPDAGEENVEEPPSSAPAHLGQTIPETDSADVDRTDTPSKASNSAPAANTISTSVFETAPSRPPTSNDPHAKLLDLSSPPILTTPPGKKRKRMSEISAEPSPQQQSTQGFDPMEALHISQDVLPFLDDSPVRPVIRSTKRRKLETPSFMVNETVQSLFRRSTRSTQQSPGKIDQPNTNPTRTKAKDIDAPIDPSAKPPSLRASTRSRASVWDMAMSPPQKQLPPKVQPKEVPAIIIEPVMKSKALASTAPEKVQVVKPGRVSLRAQTQAEPTSGKAAESPSMTSEPPHGDVTTPNVVFACFNGKSRAYYPARCLGSTETEPLRYIVQWEGYDPDEVDAYGVRSLDLRVGDQVKIDLKGFPKVSHIIRGFKHKLDSAAMSKVLTDIRGYQILVVAAKQQKSLPAELSTDAMSEVPVSAIYLDNNMWNQMKDRKYKYEPPPVPSVSLSGYATPQEMSSTPTTPSSRARRQAAAATAQVVPEEPAFTGLFANMAFAISYEDTCRKSELVNLIRENGGRLLTENFLELLGTDEILVKPQYASLGFTALIADKHSRKEKYMQALALGIPCLSGKWIERSVANETLPDWQPFLLAAGESEELEGATKSRIMERTETARVRFTDMLQARPTLLNGSKAIIVVGRGKGEIKRKPYLFLIQALGAAQIEKVADLKAAKDLVKSEDSFDWVFVEDTHVDIAKAQITGTSKGKNKAPAACKVAGNEMIVQSLIMGKLCES